MAIQIVSEANAGKQIPSDETLDAIDRAQARILNLASRNLDNLTADTGRAGIVGSDSAEADADAVTERILAPKPNPPLHAAADPDRSGEQRADMTRLPNHLICLECGNRVGLLKPHLEKAHGISPNEYRTRWDLPFDYAMVPQAYLDNKRAIAKRVGFGTKIRIGKPRNKPVVDGSPKTAVARTRMLG